MASLCLRQPAQISLLANFAPLPLLCPHQSCEGQLSNRCIWVQRTPEMMRARTDDYLKLKKSISCIGTSLSRGDDYFLVASQHLLQQALQQHAFT